MAKYIFIGDIHGKVDQVERALAMEGQKIFVGDFIDSFDKTPAEHSKCYSLVLEAIDKGEAQAIFGNHELSYLPVVGGRHRCPGWDYARKQVVEQYKDQIMTKFKPYVLLDESFLVTHAGLTKQIWDKYNLETGKIGQFLAEGWANNNWRDPIHWIGWFRGGRDTTGGIFWCDWNAEFTPVPGLTQVFGHTAGKGIRQIEQSFCIDCLDRESTFLEMDL